MSAPLPPEEVLPFLKYLRDHDFIQGIDCVSQETIRFALGWDEAKLGLVLESCHHAQSIGFLPSSSVYLTSGGLRVLVLADA